MYGQSVWRSLERSVEIQIENRMGGVTLHTPRSYCYSGFSSTPPSPTVPPGATGSCQFTNSVMRFRGAVGLLVYEGDAFSLAILFSNPFDYNRFNMELSMEIATNQAHQDSLKNIYNKMASCQNGKDPAFHRVKLGTCQEPVVVAAGRVKATATMSNVAQSIVKVVVETRDEPSN